MKWIVAVVLAGLAIAGLIMIWSQVKRVIPSEELDSLEDELSSSVAGGGIDKVTDDDRRNASFEQMREKAIAATRQLAKRQLTWLRRETAAIWYNLQSDEVRGEVIKALEGFLEA